MSRKTVSWTFKDTAEPLEGIWPVYAYLLSLEKKEAKSKFIKAMGAFWQPIALQEIGKKRKEELQSAALFCIYQIERHCDDLKTLFSVMPSSQVDGFKLDQLGDKLNPCWEIRTGIDSTSALLLSYLQKPKGICNFTVAELVRWSLIPYWQPIALSHLEAERLLITQSASHCLYLLERHILYLRESFGLKDSKVSFSPPVKTETVSHSENGWHDTTEDDEIIGNIFN